MSISRKLSSLRLILLFCVVYRVVLSPIGLSWMRFNHSGGFCCFGISRWLRKLTFQLADSQLVFFSGVFWMGLNGFALAFMVQMQTIGLLCGRNYRGCVLDGIRLGFYLVISMLLDILAKGLAVTLLAQPCLLFRIS